MNKNCCNELTTNYYIYNNNILLTKGVNSLVESVNCQWLIEIINSVFVEIHQTTEGFAIVRLRVNNQSRKQGLPSADFFVDDGYIVRYWDDQESGTSFYSEEDGAMCQLIHKQHLDITDFPQNELVLYFQYRETVNKMPQWVLMLPQEY